MASPKTKTHKTSPVPLIAGSTEPSAALASIQAELDAMGAEEVMHIRVDISRAVATALGAWPRIRELRPRLVEELPSFPRRLFDGLETYALAALYAHLSATAELADDTLKELVAEATPLRDILLIAAEALAHRGHLDATRVAEIRSGQGYLDTANDLIALGGLYAEAWPTVANKTAVERAEVDRATALGRELFAALGRREQLLTSQSPKSTRARAFTLFVRAYDACQRAVTYLRWDEGDADTLAPSLFKVRRRAGKKGGVIEESQAPGAEPEEGGAEGAPLAGASPLNGRGAGAPRVTPA